MAHKLTLLEMTQSILNSMDSDTVNSINDTIESLQIANTIKDVYYDLMARRDWEHMKSIGRLEQVGDTNQPTKIQIPDTIYEITSLKYNKKLSTDTAANFQEIQYLNPEDFLLMSLARDSTASNVLTKTMDNSTPLYILNDVMPSYWTSFDDKYIYFDSFYAADETTVQASKTIIVGVLEPSFTLTDTAVPSLPANQFPMLLETCRRTCFKRFKQLSDEEAEISSKKHYNNMRLKQNRVGGGTKYYNWGIKGKGISKWGNK